MFRFLKRKEANPLGESGRRRAREELRSSVRERVTSPQARRVRRKLAWCGLALWPLGAILFAWAMIHLSNIESYAKSEEPAWLSRIPNKSLRAMLTAEWCLEWEVGDRSDPLRRAQDLLESVDGESELAGRRRWLELVIALQSRRNGLRKARRRGLPQRDAHELMALIQRGRTEAPGNGCWDIAEACVRMYGIAGEPLDMDMSVAQRALVERACRRGIYVPEIPAPHRWRKPLVASVEGEYAFWTWCLNDAINGLGILSALLEARGRHADAERCWETLNRLAEVSWQANALDRPDAGPRHWLGEAAAQAAMMAWVSKAGARQPRVVGEANDAGLALSQSAALAAFGKRRPESVAFRSLFSANMFCKAAGLTGVFLTLGPPLWLLCSMTRPNFHQFAVPSNMPKPVVYSLCAGMIAGIAGAALLAWFWENGVPDDGALSPTVLAAYVLGGLLPALSFLSSGVMFARRCGITAWRRKSVAEVCRLRVRRPWLERMFPPYGVVPSLSLLAFWLAMALMLAGFQRITGLPVLRAALNPTIGLEMLIECDLRASSSEMLPTVKRVLAARSPSAVRSLIEQVGRRPDYDELLGAWQNQEATRVRRFRKRVAEVARRKGRTGTKTRADRRTTAWAAPRKRGSNVTPFGVEEAVHGSLLPIARRPGPRRPWTHTGTRSGAPQRWVARPARRRT